MSEKQFKYEIRPGNAAVLVNGQVRGDAAGCPRAILIRDYFGQPKVSDFRSLVTFATGSACETVVFNKLREEYGDSIRNDVEMSEAVTDDTGVVGHADFVRKTDEGFEIWEHKTCQSLNTFKKVFVKSEPKLVNIAQMLQYMITAECCEGRLLYTATLYGDAGKEHKVKAGDQKCYTIRIHTDGTITADEQMLPFTVQHALDWRNYMAGILENGLIDDPPTPWEIMPWSVCSGCDFENICEAYNEHREKDIFFGDVKKLIDLRGKR